MRTNRLVDAQLAAVREEDEYRLADSLKVLASLAPDPIVAELQGKNFFTISSQLVHEDHLWLGMLFIGSRGRTEFWCWAVELSGPILVGSYFEKKFKRSGRKDYGQNIDYFGVVSECLQLTEHGIGRQDAGRSAIALFSHKVRSGQVSLEDMTNSEDAIRESNEPRLCPGGLAGV